MESTGDRRSNPSSGGYLPRKGICEYSVSNSRVPSPATQGAAAGVERLGLRFVNEIRVPSNADTDWADWLDVGLLAPLSRPQSSIFRSLDQKV